MGGIFTKITLLLAAVLCFLIVVSSAERSCLNPTAIKTYRRIMTEPQTAGLLLAETSIQRELYFVFLRMIYSFCYNQTSDDAKEVGLLHVSWCHVRSSRCDGLAEEVEGEGGYPQSPPPVSPMVKTASINNLRIKTSHPVHD
jgi:hypothetical protein